MHPNATSGPSAMLYTTYQKIHTLTVEEVHRMHALFEAHYACSPLATFLDDLGRKEGVFVVRHKKTHQIVGFSTLGVHKFQLGGSTVKGLFSGDTIIERAHWGSRSLQTAFAWKLFLEALKSPFSRQYWLLISKGYKTYLLLARNFPDFHPQRDVPQPELESLVIDYCEALFPGKLNRQTLLLEFGEDANRLKADVATITDEMRERDADIRFFESRNPSWQQGTELPCIARADLAAFSRAIVPFVWKVLKQRVAGKPAAAQVVQPRSA